MDLRDWFIILLHAGMWTAGTVFIFKHPSEVNFATWGTLGATMTGAYHWMVIRDSKQKDAE
jgi:hypothetical protein